MFTLCTFSTSIDFALLSDNKQTFRASGNVNRFKVAQSVTKNGKLDFGTFLTPKLVLIIEAPYENFGAVNFDI